MAIYTVRWRFVFVLGFLMVSAFSEADYLPTSPVVPLEGEPFALTFDFPTTYACVTRNLPDVLVDQAPTLYVLVGTECVSGSATTLHESVVIPALPVGIYKIFASLFLLSGFDPPPSRETIIGTVRITRSESAAQEIVVEYSNGLTNHFFMTPLQNEIELLDARQPPFEGWQRTGETFKVVAPGMGADSQQTVSICRFYNDSFTPSSHFYAAHGLGCEETLAEFPDWQLETPQLFDAYPVASMDGDCPTSSVPLYRYYNNSQGGAPNHRYTTRPSDHDLMVFAGWIPEGYGVGVAMCVPQ